MDRSRFISLACIALALAGCTIHSTFEESYSTEGEVSSGDEEAAASSAGPSANASASASATSSETSEPAHKKHEHKAQPAEQAAQPAASSPPAGTSRVETGTPSTTAAPGAIGGTAVASPKSGAVNGAGIGGTAAGKLDTSLPGAPSMGVSAQPPAQSATLRSAEQPAATPATATAAAPSAATGTAAAQSSTTSAPAAATPPARKHRDKREPAVVADSMAKDDQAAARSGTGVATLKAAPTSGGDAKDAAKAAGMAGTGTGSQAIGGTATMKKAGKKPLSEQEKVQKVIDNQSERVPPAPATAPKP